MLFDAVALVVDPKGADALGMEAAAVTFVHDAFAHLKAVPGNSCVPGPVGPPRRDLHH